MNAFPGKLATRLLVAGALTASLIQDSKADEGGVSFWLPGMFGSLAATPQQPGWSFASIYYHTSVSAGGDVAFARQVNRGQLNVNFSGTLNANLKAKADLGLIIPSYVFASPFLGGQAAISMIVPVGRSKATVDATLTGAVGPIGFTIDRERTDTVSGFGDVIPQAAIRWNKGVDNYMVYITGNVPVGAYDPNRLTNLGLGHVAIDAGGGYTYLNPQTGREFSVVAGMTYNFENPDTKYQSGIDFHVDWGASQFLSKQFLVGLVGYGYQQLTADSGAGNRMGSFESRVFGIGPQLGYIVPLGDHQGYFNIKGYKEFGAQHRPEGWNVWATLVISPAAAQASTAPRRPTFVK